MSRARVGRFAPWLGAALSWLVAAWAVRSSLPSPPGAPLGAQFGVARVQPFDSAGLATSADDVRARNIFRVDRRPPTVRLEPWPAAPLAPVVAAPTVARPVLRVVGLLGGARAQVVVEGVPGFERGLLLRSGEEVGGYTLVRITGDTVVLRGRDSTWTLVPKRTW